MSVRVDVCAVVWLCVCVCGRVCGCVDACAVVCPWGCVSVVVALGLVCLVWRCGGVVCDVCVGFVCCVWFGLCCVGRFGLVCSVPGCSGLYWCGVRVLVCLLCGNV